MSKFEQKHVEKKLNEISNILQSMPNGIVIKYGGGISHVEFSHDQLAGLVDDMERLTDIIIFWKSLKKLEDRYKADEEEKSKELKNEN